MHLNANKVTPARNSSNFDKSYKIRASLDMVNKLKNRLKPHEHLDINKLIIKFKEQSTLKKYMPEKLIQRR